MKQYVFNRYHGGQRMAEGIAVHANTLGEAQAEANKLKDPLDTLLFGELKKCPKRNKRDVAKGLQCSICYPSQA